jgi:hypothetical protein
MSSVSQCRLYFSDWHMFCVQGLGWAELSCLSKLQFSLWFVFVFERSLPSGMTRESIEPIKSYV